MIDINHDRELVDGYLLHTVFINFIIIILEYLLSYLVVYRIDR